MFILFNRIGFIMNHYNQIKKEVNRENSNNPVFSYWEEVRMDAAADPSYTFAGRERTTDRSGETPETLPELLTGGGSSIKQLKLGGVDCLRYGLQGEWSKNSDLIQHLKEAREKDVHEVQHLGVRFQLLPAGMRDGVYYKYCIKWHGVQILFHDNPIGSIAPVRVHIPGLVCMLCPWQLVCKQVKTVLSIFGFKCTGSTVSRVDLQVTLDVDYKTAAADVVSDRIVTECRGKRYRIDDLGRNAEQTIWYKSATVQMCVYDKLQELAVTPFEYFDSYYHSVDDLTEHKTRVEFRLSSDALRQRGIRSLEDLAQNIAHCADYYTSTWFRVLGEEKKRGRENKQELSPFWSLVRAAFLSVWKSNPFKPRPYKPAKERLPERLENLVKQARGCLSRFVSLQAEGTRQSIISYIVDALDRVSEGLPERARQMVIERLLYGM